MKSWDAENINSILQILLISAVNKHKPSQDTNSSNASDHLKTKTQLKNLYETETGLAKRNSESDISLFRLKTHKSLSPRICNYQRKHKKIDQLLIKNKTKYVVF